MFLTNFKIKIEDLKDKTQHIFNWEDINVYVKHIANNQLGKEHELQQENYGTQTLTI